MNLSPYAAGDRVEFQDKHGAWHTGIVNTATPIDGDRGAPAPWAILVEYYHPGAGRYLFGEATCDHDGTSERLRFDPDHGSCTCHHPPKPMSRPNRRSEWGHDDDQTYAEVFHVHADTNSRDCDGPMDRGRTYQVTSLKDCESADDLWRTLCAMELTAHAIKQEIEICGQEHTATFHENTDEGFSRTVLHGCTEPGCAHDGSTQRDYYAEQMGY